MKYENKFIDYDILNLNNFENKYISKNIEIILKYFKATIFI
jgi:hypothetical protein